MSNQIVVTKLANLAFKASELARASIDAGQSTKAVQLGEASKAILYLQRTLSYPFLLTVAGAQGTGKSTLVNNWLGLSKEAQVPSGPQTCEQLPLLLISVKELPEAPVSIWSFTANNDGEQELHCEMLQYSSARERVHKPLENDLYAEWSVAGSIALERLGAVAMMPGMEIGSWWQQRIELMLEASDMVLVVADQVRLAQNAHKKILDWLEKAEISIPSMLVLTKADSLSQAEIDSLKQCHLGLSHIGIWETETQNSETLDAFQKALLNKIVESSGARSYRRSLRAIGKIDSCSSEIEVSAKVEKTVDDVAVVDLIEQQASIVQTQWKSLIQERLLSAMNGSVNEAMSKSRSSIAGLIDGLSFWDAIDIWISGGPQVGFVRELEHKPREVFEEHLRSASRTAIAIEMQKTKAELFGTDVVSEDDLVSRMISLPLLDLVLFDKNKASLDEYMSMVENDFVSCLTQAKGISSGLLEWVNDGLEASGNIMNKLDSMSSKKQTDSVTAQSGMALVGSSQAAIEAAGGGVEGAALSANVGVIATAVAVAALAGMAVSVARSMRQVKLSSHAFGEQLVNDLGKTAVEHYSAHLEKFWVQYETILKCKLRRLVGLDTIREKRIRVLIAVEEVRRAANDARKWAISQ